MKKIILSVAVLGAILSSCENTGREIKSEDTKKVEVKKTETSVIYNTIKDESKVNWFATHLGGLMPRNGNVLITKGNLVLTNNKVTGGDFIIGIETLSFTNSDNAEDKKKLENHLKTPDFFNVEKYPTSSFEITSVTNTEGDYNSSVTGNLTILDSTRSITFNANITTNENEINIKSEKFAIDRTQWGITFHKEGSEGIPAEYIISNEIGFQIDATITK